MHEPQSRLVRISSPLVWDVLLYGLLVGVMLYWRLASQTSVNESANWPAPADVRLSWPRGIALAVLLIASSATIRQALRMASHRACGARWLGWTVGIGLMFVALQLSEVRTRVRQNLIPDPFGSGVHNRADLYYLSAVRQRLQVLTTELNAATIEANLSEAGAKITQPDDAEFAVGRQERLALVNRLQTAELNWTESEISQQSPPKAAEQRAALISLAQDVFPIQAYAETHRQFREKWIPELARRVALAEDEVAMTRLRIVENSPALKAMLAKVAELNGQLKTIREQLKKLPPDEDSDALPNDTLPVEELSANEQSTAPEGVERRAAIKQQLEQELETLQPQYDAASAELTRIATLVTDAEETVSRLNSQISSARARIQLLGEMPAVGLNKYYPWLHLPVAIPSGRKWAIAYFGLILFHLAHVVVGLLRCLPRLMRCDRPLALANLAVFWHIQVVAGCVLLVLFYVV